MRLSSLAILLAVLGFALQPLALGMNGPCCCLVNTQRAAMQGHDESASTEPLACCSLSDLLEEEEDRSDESDESDDERGGCCDCPKQCCSGVKVHVGQTAPTRVPSITPSAPSRPVVGDQTALGSSHVDRLKRPPRVSVPA